MKARTGMLLSSLLLLSAIAQANEPMSAKPVVIKVAAGSKLANSHPAAQQEARTAADGEHLACENSTSMDPPAERVRAPAGKSAKSAPAAPKRSRRLGCDSFHCVARAPQPAAGETPGSQPGV